MGYIVFFLLTTLFSESYDQTNYLYSKIPRLCNQIYEDLIGKFVVYFYHNHQALVRRLWYV